VTSANGAGAMSRAAAFCFHFLVDLQRTGELGDV
jgi:hypothetical protein